MKHFRRDVIQYNIFRITFSTKTKTQIFRFQLPPTPRNWFNKGNIVLIIFLICVHMWRIIHVTNIKIFWNKYSLFLENE